VYFNRKEISQSHRIKGFWQKMRASFR